MDRTPAIQPVPSLPRRIGLWFGTWMFKTIVNTMLSLLPIFRPKVTQKYAPTFTKRYPVRSMLETRVFIPAGWKAGTTSKLPLYIDIHGGAFLAGLPRLDDKYCHYISNRSHCAVISLQYRLAPSHPFPTGLDDCTELVLAILDDDDLSYVDRENVVMGGQSAGGYFALTVAQDPRLRKENKIKALVPFYPPTDLSQRFSGDFRDKPAGLGPDGNDPAEKDGLRAIVPLGLWAYIPYGYDRTDPRMSPIYADRAALPPRIYFIGAQYDKLCEEGFLMAKTMAGKPDLKEETTWEVDGIRWERVSDETHGFIEAGWRAELFGGPLPWKKGTQDLLDRLAEWLDAIWRS